MTTKCSWLFNGSSQTSGKAWGFSETWYSPLAGDQLLLAMDSVSRVRCQILSLNTEIVGYRIGDVTGRSFVLRKSFSPPDSNSASNLPVDCALCQMAHAGGDSIKRFMLHDLPDDWVARTAIEPDRRLAIQRVIQKIEDNGFFVRYQDPAAISAQVLAVNSTGLVTTVGAFAAAAGMTIQFLACRDNNRRPIRGTYVVTAVTDANNFQLAHWGGQVVGRSGRVRRVSFLYGTAIAFGIERSIIGAAAKKVGRPFFQLRGRVPVRR